MTTGPGGPLEGVRVLEIAGMGPVPFAGMMLADLGADVVRVERPASVARDRSARPLIDVMARGRRSIGIDLKTSDGPSVVRRLAARSDVMMEGFRPGVAERLGIGPDVCRAENARLVYGRVTGWGRTGPYASAAGHDINYLALAGALYPIGRPGSPPPPPLNLVGDFGGGGMLLALGIVSALFEREKSGFGQTVDTAMVDGAALLTTSLFGMRSAGAWSDNRGDNLLDSGAPFYDSYETADGRYVSVGAIEPEFFDELLRRLGLADEFPRQRDRSCWPAMRSRLAETFLTRSRDEWCVLLEGTDSCFAPVLAPGETADHPHHRARGSFIDIGGIEQPAPAPHFSRTELGVPSAPRRSGEDTHAVLSEAGFTEGEIADLRTSSTIHG